MRVGAVLVASIFLVEKDGDRDMFCDAVPTSPCTSLASLEAGGALGLSIRISLGWQSLRTGPLKYRECGGTLFVEPRTKPFLW